MGVAFGGIAHHRTNKERALSLFEKALFSYEGSVSYARELVSKIRCGAVLFRTASLRPLALV